MAAGIALVVEVVEQSGDRPLLLIAVEALGETAHRGLHREAMLAQAVALRVLAQQGEGFLAVHRRDAITERPAPVVAAPCHGGCAAYATC